MRKSIENLSDKAKHTDETVRVLINTIESQQAQGVEIFKSADLLLDKLAIITVGADEVMTLNLSPARGYSNSLDNYFEKVNEYILSKKSKLISFRTLASIDTGKKAKWVWERSILLSPSKKASTALFATKNLQMPIGFHIVVNRAINVPFVFIYPPVSTSGEGVGFLVKNEKISETMIGFFEMLWGKSLKVHLGNEFHKEGLDFLVDLCPDIKDTKEYAQIINNIS